MRIIIKALLSSLIEKKARTFLVLFSIAVSASLIFANESFSRTVAQRFYEADTRWSGVSDLYIESRNAVGAKEWIDPAQLAPFQDAFEYAFQFIREKALYAPSLEEMHYFTIIGADIEAFNRYNPVTLSEGDFNNWTGNSIIIGSTYANLYDFHVGDVMTLEMNNSAHDFKITGISEVKGLFLRELADGGFILVPKETLEQIFYANSGGAGITNLIFIKLKDPTQKEAVKTQLTQALPDFNVQYGINDAVIAAETQNYVMPFQVSSVVVVFMCMFIIFTAFNLVTLERIPIVGTLRSIGCTRKRINSVLIVESAALGAVGGLFGCLLGVGVLQYIKAHFASEEAIANASVLFGGREILITVGAAVLITTLSAIIPILRLTKTPIKAIILNDLGRKGSKPSRLWMAGVVLLAACAVVPRFLSSNFTGMVIASTLATLALVGLVPLIPFLTRHISRLAGKIAFLPQDVVLGVRNIRDNPSLMNNIQLFAAAIAIVAFMASMFNTMGADLLKNFEQNWKFDIEMALRHSDEQTLADINQIDGVASSAGFYLTHTAILNYGTFMNNLYGIDNADFFRFNYVDNLDANQEALAALNHGKNIITTFVLRDTYGLKLGDQLLLQFGSQEIPYTITGFVDTNMGIGRVGYISSANYRADMGVADYDYIDVRVSEGAGSVEDAALVKNNILRALTKDVIRIQTKQDLISANADKVVGIFGAINSYCYLALLVGILGIVNNLIASFIERKRSFAMLRCVGMSKKALNRMLVTEAVGMGLFGVAYGIACALIMSSTIPAAVSVFWGNVVTQLAVKEMLIIGLVGGLAMLAISVVPVLRSKRMNLIETIKYE